MIFLLAGTTLCNRAFGRLRCGPSTGRGAVSFSREERLIMTAAFRRAWKTLLVEERITAQNIEFIPTMLMEAIVDAAHAGERDEQLLAAAALVRMASHERDELETGVRVSSDRLH